VQGDAIAAQAVDRNLATQAVTSTAGGEGWIKLEFDRTYFIHKIRIYYKFFNDWYEPNWACMRNEEQFKQCVKNDNNVDVSVYQGDAKRKSCGTLQLTNGLEQSDQIYTLICNIEGDMVKLSKNTGNIAVAEVAVVSTGNCSQIVSHVNFVMVIILNSQLLWM
jgi:hypothetical protein